MKQATSRGRVRSGFAVMAAVFAAVAVTAPAGALEPEQFVVGWPLDVPAGEKVVDVALTPEVYRYARSDRELAVLDAAGNPLPFFRVGAAAVTVTEQRVALTPSPLYSVTPTRGGAEVSVATGAGQTNVTVTQPGADAAAQVVAFVLDARATAARPSAIDLVWKEQPEPFLLDVRIEQSRTLTDWRPVGRASVASLRIAGANVLHGRVPVNAEAGGYFRVSWGAAVPDWYLESATLVSSTIAPTTLEVAVVAALTATPPQVDPPPANALYFDAGGTLPASSVALDFAGGSGWANASVATAAAPEGPWQPVAYAPLFYQIDFQGESFASEPLALGRREARYWRIVTPEPLAANRVALRLRYPAEQLRVSVAGAAPYQLAAGTLAAAGPDSTFAAVWRELRAPSAPPRVALGTLRELGGAAALDAPYQFPWRVTLLWAVLGGGALVVAFMAVRLARELGAPR